MRAAERREEELGNLGEPSDLDVLAGCCAA